MEYLTPIERDDAKNKSITEPRLEKFSILVGSGVDTPQGAFREAFGVSKTESTRLVSMQSRLLMLCPGVHNRVKEIRQEYLARLKEEVLVEQVEGIAVLAERMRDPRTASRDVVPIFNALSEALNWKSGEVEAVDPVMLLLDEIDGR